VAVSTAKRLDRGDNLAICRKPNKGATPWRDQEGHQARSLQSSLASFSVGPELDAKKGTAGGAHPSTAETSAVSLGEINVQNWRLGGRAVRRMAKLAKTSAVLPSMAQWHPHTCTDHDLVTFGHMRLAQHLDQRACMAVKSRAKR
jgi:hypothetical protein